MSTLVAVAALAVFLVIFLAGLLLLVLFVRNAAFALIAVTELRDKTSEADERKATVAAAREAVDDIRRNGEAFGGSGTLDFDALRSVQAEAAINGRPYRVDENERRNVGDEQPEYTDTESVSPFYVPASEQGE